MSTSQSWTPPSLLNYTIPSPPTHPSIISHQHQIRFTIRTPDITSRCLHCLRHHLLRRRRTMISVPQTFDIERTFNGYVESEVIRPIVSLLNGLRQQLLLPILKYELKSD